MEECVRHLLSPTIDSHTMACFKGYAGGLRASSPGVCSLSAQCMGATPPPRQMGSSALQHGLGSRLLP